jgi:hypothetical protein
MQEVLHPFIQSLLDTDMLSESSKKVYIERIKSLKSYIGDVTLFDAILQPEATYEAIDRKATSLTCKAKLVSTILAIMKYNPEAFDDHESVQTIWRQYKTNINSELSKEKEDGVLTQRESQSFMSWHDIVHIASQVTDIWDKLLVSMYTLIPPARNDYYALEICEMNQKVPDNSNYILLLDESHIELVLHQYKTRKTYGMYRKQLPQELVDIIYTSLKEHPRKWVFPNRRHFDEPMTKNNMIKWMQKRFLCIFKKPLTINTLRHSFITSIDFNASTPGQLLGYARDMHHSYSEQLFYRRFIEEASSDIS